MNSPEFPHSQRCGDPHARPTQGRVAVADTSTGETKWELNRDEAILEVAYTADGTTLAFAGSAGMAGLADTSGGGVLGLFAHAEGGPDIVGLAVSMDGRFVATYDTNCDTRVYLTESQQLVSTFENVGPITTPKVLEFSADSTALLLAKGNDNVRLIDLATGAEVYSIGHGEHGPLGPRIGGRAEPGRLARRHRRR
jgi:WD40 repeat protein